MFSSFVGKNAIKKFYWNFVKTQLHYKSRVNQKKYSVIKWGLFADAKWHWSRRIPRFEIIICETKLQKTKIMVKASINFFWVKTNENSTRNGRVMQMQICVHLRDIGFLHFHDNFIAFDLVALEANDVSHVQSFFTLVITETDWYFKSRWIFKKERK